MSKKKQEIFYEMGFSSHQGTQKEVNEDNYCTLHRESEEEGSKALVGVSDGVGGFSLGEIASKITINNLEKFFKMGEFDQMLNEAEFLEPPRVIQELYTRINHVIRSLMEKENRQVGCTLVTGFFHDYDAYVANIGNSRAYLVRDGSIKTVTEERGDPLPEIKLSQATTEDTLAEGSNPAYVNSLGSDITLAADIHRLTLREGDILIFCSDGLYTQVSETDILDTAATASTMQKFVGDLIQKANDNGGEDNVTVVAVRITVPRGIFAPGKSKSWTSTIPVILGIILLTAFLIFGSYKIFKKIAGNSRDRDPHTGFRIKAGPGQANVYNSVTIETEVPLSSVRANEKSQKITDNYQTFVFDKDTNRLEVMPDVSKYRPALYTMTIMGLNRDLKVVQGNKNRVIVEPEKITVYLTVGSQVDFIAKQDRTGDKFQVTINNLGTPFTIIMKSQENLYALIKPDKRAKKSIPGKPAPSPGTGKKPVPAPTVLNPTGEPLNYKLE